MLSPKQFLEQECENTETVINECLRHDYAGGRTLKIFRECSERLAAIKSKIGVCADADSAELKQLAYRLSRLSSLIARVERSKLGEFSWPFASELQKIAEVTCQGTTGGDAYYDEPLFAISAEGGLDAYSILDEQDQVDFANHRIFNIVFPRSLKHHVLFHAILAHEIGHAALTVPSMIEVLTGNVIAVLEDGPFADDDTFAQWYEQSGLGDMSAMAGDDIDDMLTHWVEECFCDLFGLVVLGPAFFAAHCSLLTALDPQGLSPGDDHPPNVVRFDLLTKAAASLQWTAPQAFWKPVTDALPHIPEWARCFTGEQIEAVVTALQRILEPLGPSLYRPPRPAELEQLTASIARAVPPTGAGITAGGAVTLSPLDFRVILFAGWLCWYRQDNPDLTFFQINQLCDQAILQQQAVDLWLSHTGEEEG